MREKKTDRESIQETYTQRRTRRHWKDREGSKIQIRKEIEKGTDRKKKKYRQGRKRGHGARQKVIDEKETES